MGANGCRVVVVSQKGGVYLIGVNVEKTDECQVNLTFH